MRKARGIVFVILIPREEDLEMAVKASGKSSDNPETRRANQDCDGRRDDTSECSDNSEDIYDAALAVQLCKA